MASVSNYSGLAETLDFKRDKAVEGEIIWVPLLSPSSLYTNLGAKLHFPVLAGAYKTTKYPGFSHKTTYPLAA
jgi:hypothetical protein